MPDQCGNPLLRDWVKEWMDKSREFSSKSYFTYKKAYESLCKCPVEFSHPSEAICLAGIGEKMVKKFEENMRIYCLENNLPMPPKPRRKRRLDVTFDDSNTRPARPRNTKTYVPGYRTGGYAILLAMLEFQRMDRVNLTREQICSIAQDYCDASFTLAEPGKSYTAWNSINTLCDKGYVWKNGKPAKYSLTETGTAMAEKLKQANHGSAPASSSSEIDLFALAASSRSTPKRKGRASKQSSTGDILDRLLESMGNPNTDEPDMSLYVLNPSQHQSISLNGKTVTNNNNNSSSSSSSRFNAGGSSSDSNRITMIPESSTSSFITNSNRSSFAQQVSQAVDSNDFEDLYSRPSSTLNTPKRKTVHKNTNKKKYNVDSFEIDLTPASLPEFHPSSQRTTNHEPNIVDLLSSPEMSPSFKESDFLFENEFDSDRDFFPLSQSRNERILNETFQYTYLDTQKEPVRHASMAEVQIIDCNVAYLVKFFNKQASHPKALKITQQIMDGDYITGYLYEQDIDTVCPGLPATPILPLHQASFHDMFWPDQNRPSQTSSQGISNEIRYSQISSQGTLSVNEKRSSQIVMDTQSLEDLMDKEPCQTFLPHEYEIILVLDSREIQMKNNREYFQERLATKGVKCITRSLDLGDVIWVAKKKNSQQNTDELVLDYIVERKRLDDLVTSIKDGRFIEQKSRLKKSGAEKVIYVVEEYNREEAERFGAQAIQTALSSTQMIDGIFLKRTANIDETIDYFVSITQLMKRIYQGFTLHSIPAQIVTRQNYLDLKEAYKKRQQPKSAYLPNYILFNELNAKGGATSLHDIYLRMLMTIRGVNAERALSLIKVYPTPHALLNAFKGKSETEAKLLAKHATTGHISRRRWGSSISEKLYEVWAATEYPSVLENYMDDYYE